MEVAKQWVRVASATLALAYGLGTQPAYGVDQQTVEELRRDFEAMRRRLEQVEDLTRKQEEKIREQEKVIQRLGGYGVTPPPAAAAAVTAPAPSTADEERLKQSITDNIMRKIQPSLAAANKTFASQFNPAIGLVIDSVASYSARDRGNFEFRSAEIGLSASVDPFVRGYAIFNGGPDEIEVEEAAIVTTSLPYNLGLKGGRFFADFGRLSKFHDHDLPFVNRPQVLDQFVGGESQADGVEASWLVPIPHYLTLTAGAYNKIGAENERVSNLEPRSLSEFTYLGKAATFVNLTDSNSIDLGVSWAYTPKVKNGNDSPRQLGDVELTYRYLPPSQASYRGLVWGTEYLWNREDRPIGGFPDDFPDMTPASALTFRQRDSAGLYSYLEARLTRRYYPGFLFDWNQNIDGNGDTFAYSPYFTMWASEFQRIRLQYTHLEEPGNHDDQFFLQWTVVLGSHVHGFRER